MAIICFIKTDRRNHEIQLPESPHGPLTLWQLPVSVKIFNHLVLLRVQMPTQFKFARLKKRWREYIYLLKNKKITEQRGPHNAWHRLKQGHFDFKCRATLNYNTIGILIFFPNVRFFYSVIGFIAFGQKIVAAVCFRPSKRRQWRKRYENTPTPSFKSITCPKNKLPRSFAQSCHAWGGAHMGEECYK